MQCRALVPQAACSQAAGSPPVCLSACRLSRRAWTSLRASAVLRAAAMSKPIPAVPVASAVPVAAGVPLSGPPGAPLGGVYTIESHCGVITILIAVFVFPCICCCPCDTQEVYVAPDGTRWLRTGARLPDGKRCCCFL